ncbi:type II toxin-antitoxin system HicA family toxin [Mongoliibacter ruber]|uniref:type II toxin-antitoxin system HicA family toxin n=1 Tax=Mongoliibacter ruber TaxID=1750599 RepID=UPI000D07537B|nr:type II toxin-antitoxin system HicA family toxin [Mongoliibacter ruber]
MLHQEGEQQGFELKPIKGSHHYYQPPGSGKITVVPLHKKDLPKGTFFAIFKQAGIDKNEL